MNVALFRLTKFTSVNTAVNVENSILKNKTIGQICISKMFVVYAVLFTFVVTFDILHYIRSISLESAFNVKVFTNEFFVAAKNIERIIRPRSRQFYRI